MLLAEVDDQTVDVATYTRVLQKVLSLGSDYFSATFYQTYFLLQTFKVFPLY